MLLYIYFFIVITIIVIVIIIPLSLALLLVLLLLSTTTHLWKVFERKRRNYWWSVDTSPSRKRRVGLSSITSSVRQRDIMSGWLLNALVNCFQVRLVPLTLWFLFEGRILYTQNVRRQYVSSRTSEDLLDYMHSHHPYSLYQPTPPWYYVSSANMRNIYFFSFVQLFFSSYNERNTTLRVHLKFEKCPSHQYPVRCFFCVFSNTPWRVHKDRSHTHGPIPPQNLGWGRMGEVNRTSPASVSSSIPLAARWMHYLERKGGQPFVSTFVPISQRGQPIPLHNNR